MGESVKSHTTLRPVALALAVAWSCFSLGGPALHAVPASPVPTHGSVTGIARVVDGDTLEIGGTRVRLEGIDAPEAGQSCARAWLGRWDCGAAATNALAKLVAPGEVRCTGVGNDRYGRLLGICFAGGVEINARMVADGHAWAFLKYSARYAEVEATARAAKRGIFATDNEPAWVYREKRWQVAEQTAPEGCAIKGNVSKTGRIYHMPWSPWYGKVKVDTAKGERWFCSETEAAAAGFRPVLAH